MLSWPARDPDWIKDYRFNVKLDEGDTLASISFAQVRGSAVIDRQEQDATGITVWLAGGIEGETQEYRAVWTSAGGRTDDETITQLVRQGGDLTAQLQARFPDFASVPAATVSYWLTDAAQIVTGDWLPQDRDAALMELAAHNMATNGIGGADALPAGVTRWKSGSADISVDAAAAQARALGGYGATPYGQQFVVRLRRNRGGPRLC